MSDASVLAANEASYRAFAAGDLAAMEAIWAAEGPVTCIHPGWPALSGREAVMGSWRDILSGRPPPVRVEGVEVHHHGGAALVLCREIIGTGVLAASNLFVLTGDGWRLVHHQATPQAPRPAAEPPAPRRVLH